MPIQHNNPIDVSPKRLKRKLVRKGRLITPEYYAGNYDLCFYPDHQSNLNKYMCDEVQYLVDTSLPE